MLFAGSHRWRRRTQPIWEAGLDDLGLRGEKSDPAQRALCTHTAEPDHMLSTAARSEPRPFHTGRLSRPELKGRWLLPSESYALLILLATVCSSFLIL